MGALEAKLHYAVIYPSELHSQHSENICFHLEGAEGETIVNISLNLDNKDTRLIEKIFKQDSIFSCLNIQVPIPVEEESVGTIILSITSSGNSVMNTNKVLVKKKLEKKILVQTDKAVYKPGQTVKFRILSLNEDFKPQNILIPVVEVQDPDKNRIAQWLNVTLSQGIAELSLALSSEPKLGEYSINLKDRYNTFSVEEYVLPKFEVHIHFPTYVLFNTKQFTVEICAKYTYGKPVQGNFTASICRDHRPHYYYWGESRNDPPMCDDFSGKLDKSGCHTIEVKTGLCRLYDTLMKNELTGEASVTEEETGVVLSSTSRTRITNTINKISFVNADSTYKPGFPYSGSIKVEDAGGFPKPNINLHLLYEAVVMHLVSDENGLASFTLNTTNWRGVGFLQAKSDKSIQGYIGGLNVPDYGYATHSVNNFYSQTKSFLKLNSLNNGLPCEGHQEVHVEYIISHTELKEAKKLTLHYLLISKVSIKDSGTVEIKTENTDKDFSGKVTLNLPLSEITSKILHVLVYIFLSNGEMLADTKKVSVLKCFKNKVSARFSPDEVLPGSDVSLQLQAAPGSLCGLRVVDQSVVLMKPDKELTADKVFDLFPSDNFQWYDHRIQDREDACLYSTINPSPGYLGTFNRRIKRRIEQWYPTVQTMDVYSLFMALRLRIVTSAVIKKPLRCSDFPIMPNFGGVGGIQPGVGGILPGVGGVGGIQLGVGGIPPGVGGVGGFGASLPGVGGLGTGIVAGGIAAGVGVGEPAISSRDEPKEVEKVRTYFPETWIWELVALGESGRSEIHHKAPDTITDWSAGAVCMGPSGFGISPQSSLRVFQPFFVDLTLPYSIVRGESFTLKASVFNYLKQCIKVQTTLQTTDELEEKQCADCQYSSCICEDESKTFYWNLKASKLGEVNITVKTEAVDTQEFCGNEIPVVPKQGRTDTIVKTILVQPGGVLVEKAHSSLICIKEGGQAKVEEISLKIPDHILKDSARAHITVLGDLMGTAMQNLDHLLAMPYGCGEQNMVLFAPNIFILQYLEKTHQLNKEIQSKAKKFLESGYQRQLTYKHDDGSYSAFGKSDTEGNMWLTGFVVKSFINARPYIFIDESPLQQTLLWVKYNQQSNGCFRNVGMLFNNAMKGGVEDDISLSAYMSIALLEANASVQNPSMRNALSCLSKASMTVSNVYTQALMAYAFTLSGDTELRKTLMDKLEKKAVRGDGQLHWKREAAPPSKGSYWYQASSAEVELTSYVLLALLCGPTPDIGKAAQIVNWLSKQQNPYGGFSSTQDTVVALQALAKYAEITFSDKGDMNVAVSSNTGFLEQFHVDKNNRLLLQRASLSKIPEDYTVTSTGSGCVFVQAVLRYNVPPLKDKDTFSLSVNSSSRIECLGDHVTKFEILITAAYTGTREKSNMAVIEVKMLSGYIPVKSTVRKLEKDKLIKRSDIQTDSVTLYLDQIDRIPVNLSFMVEQDVEVKDLKPAIAKVYDYYETDEHASGEYNHPCNADKSGNSGYDVDFLYSVSLPKTQGWN